MKARTSSTLRPWATNSSGVGTTALNGTLGATGVTVATGTLTAGSANRFTNTPTVVVSNGAALNLAGNETFGSLAGAGAVSNSAGIVTAGDNNSSTTFSGILSGAGGLTPAQARVALMLQLMSRDGRIARAAN
jgi:hypothetical protein